MKLSDQVAALEARVEAAEKATCVDCASLLDRMARTEAAIADGVDRYLKLRRQVELCRSQVIDRLANVSTHPDSWHWLTQIRDLLDAMTDPKYLGSS